MAIVEIIERLTRTDAARVGELLPQVVREVDGNVRDNLDRVVDDSNSSLLVVRADTGQIAGSLVMNLLPKAGGLEGRLNDVVVDERFRGQGLGRLLCETALRKMMLAGAYKAELSSRPSRVEANSLYLSIFGEPRETNVYTKHLKP